MIGASRLRDVLRAVLAGTVLVGLVAGSPVVLYLVAGSPLPSRIPAPGKVLDLLTSRDDGTLFLGLIEVIAWAAWAAFAFAVFTESWPGSGAFVFAPGFPASEPSKGWPPCSSPRRRWPSPPRYPPDLPRPHL